MVVCMKMQKSGMIFPFPKSSFVREKGASMNNVWTLGVSEKLKPIKIVSKSA
jgi:hypothetical protein